MKRQSRWPTRRREGKAGRKGAHTRTSWNAFARSHHGRIAVALHSQRSLFRLLSAWQDGQVLPGDWLQDGQEARHRRPSGAWPCVVLRRSRTRGQVGSLFALQPRLSTAPGFRHAHGQVEKAAGAAKAQEGHVQEMRPRRSPPPLCLPALAAARRRSRGALDSHKRLIN